ncbi:MAG: hypothetical protein O2819_05750 [Planctomycetota bacterium]|nr:hypothetical protein [Planctomycetota bacterium]
MLEFLATAPASAASASGGDASMLLVGLGLLGLAIVFLVLELFVPSGGLLAILTILTALGGVISLFLWNELVGLVAMVAMLLAGPIIAVQGVKWWSRTPIGKRAVLNVEAGGGAVRDAAPTGEGERSTAPGVALGARGITETPLRPGGFMRIGSARVDAIAEGRFIDAGEEVEVIGRVEAQWRVRRTGGGTLPR